MKLNELLTYLHDRSIEYNENPTITSIEMDSREVKNGSLFICIDGYTVDGHDFAEKAVENGAVAILSERQLQVDVPVIVVKDTKRAMAVLADIFYGQPTHQMHLIGVTGTNGKTTTTHIIEKILKEANKKTGLIGTMYIKIAEKQIDVKNTTPESLTLQKTFQDMRENDVTHAVMEVSSHALHLGRIHGCDFNVAVFTNLSQDHLDYHKTMEAYKYAKGLLFAQLGNRFDHDNIKIAVLNADEEASEEFIKMTSAKIMTYGINKEADVMAKEIKMTSKGTEFQLITPVGIKHISINMIGKFSIYNVLAAVAASLASSIELDTICHAVEAMDGVRGRFELVDGGQDFTVIVDYAHTPDSLENVLQTIKQFVEGKIFCVVGCGGDRDKTKRPLMAKIATEFSDEPIFTSDNPRSEDPRMILRDMEAGVAGEHYHSIENREKAILFAVENAKKGDVILIAGKGHETYQIIGDETFDFDDKEVAFKAINKSI
ncbi:UDP-N-acetylmuramoyl-L-alanyl-D-glutamate--2,6-diaminopimelate ligase [Metabacillus sediminilitoris]|uniref:UDP-N-acetylmuramoyl-L-alanyl-D-glutamate--2,6-diaminopimelate ligase n=1 Tax=Metabacillus sediminilitoris TaxID=2567941 RepID=A0A4S4C5I6_9BACI|nr:UDP-N-acetylmuramoyl-L-alanyl-D-glutamate--2,6-diaminopimelate ligase [Metabacillus sediminilitoris]QGQ46950.1 UDP-N-acetylmuramoyl-L-alanyl-D-glutamate--2,6-diaminopimelate ligase [Metabacillus sediminilitoris]THF83099.1 UDP-N-acetylmuramoyl-L-alanyl-D-glutamate--2,6-diaminopimelate ligase [Metabacillus sediminilitoris]